jgi:hypothetical protein
MSKHNANAGEVSSMREPEEIAVNWRVRDLVELSKFPQAQLEYFTPIHCVYPCAECGEPVALVKLGHEIRSVDCFRDDLRSIHQPAWNANILSEHRCAGGCQ